MSSAESNESVEATATEPMEGIFEKVREIVAQQLGVEKEKVTLQASFANDLGADSLDTVELVMAIEEEFSIEISDSDAEKIGNLSEVIDFIKGVLKKE